MTLPSAWTPTDHIPFEDVSVMASLDSSSYVLTTRTFFFYSTVFGLDNPPGTNLMVVAPIDEAEFPLVVEVTPFRSDLGTIPWFIQWYIPKLGPWNVPTILHDFLLQHRYLYPHLSRRCIDDLFLEALQRRGVSGRRQLALYVGARLNSIYKEGFN